jgi:hypothetical protein
MKTSMPPDFSFQISNLMFLLIPILKAIWDVHFYQLQGKAVNHKKSLTFACFFGALISYVDFRISPVPYFWQSAGLAIGYFFFFFDYIRNLFAGEKLTYVDDDPHSDPEEDSWVDVNIWAKMDWTHILFLKAWFFLVAISCYYFLSYITGSSTPVLVR